MPRDTEETESDDFGLEMALADDQTLAAGSTVGGKRKNRAVKKGKNKKKKCLETIVVPSVGDIIEVEWVVEGEEEKKWWLAKVEAEDGLFTRSLRYSESWDKWVLGGDVYEKVEFLEGHILTNSGGQKHGKHKWRRVGKADVGIAGDDVEKVGEMERNVEEGVMRGGRGKEGDGLDRKSEEIENSEMTLGDFMKKMEAAFDAIGEKVESLDRKVGELSRGMRIIQKDVEEVRKVVQLGEKGSGGGLDIVKRELREAEDIDHSHDLFLGYPESSESE